MPVSFLVFKSRGYSGPIGKLVCLAVVMAAGLLFFAGCSEPAERAVPKLIKQLSDKDSHQRSLACQKLATYQEEAEAAVPALIRRLSDPNLGVRSTAAYALRKIGTPEAEEALANYK